ncbi:MAG: hypothetical protein LBP64_09030 [Tannerella sp.]|nr:hypothetical protein [Tannerella sp.]
MSQKARIEVLRARIEVLRARIEVLRVRIEVLRARIEVLRARIEVLKELNGTPGTGTVDFRQAGAGTKKGDISYIIEISPSGAVTSMR